MDHPSQGHPLIVELDALPVLSYAMAHNQVPFVYRLAMTHFGVELHDVVISLEVVDAEGRLSRPYEQRFESIGDGRTEVTDLGLTLDPAAMLQLDDQRPGTIHAEVRAGDMVIGEAEATIRLLAARQWLYLEQRPTLSLEMLAAFVMPNDPAVTALMAEVAARLERTTGSASIQGYQTDEQRADQIVKAIFEVVQQRRIAYSNSPVSWGDRGQKIRTPTDVLEGKIGTCLDTVVVMAAALEQAGIRPLLWVVEGHTFLGYWRIERALDAIAHTDVGDVVNAIDLDQIRLVETTMVTAADIPHAFEDTHRPPYATYLTGDLSRVKGVVDVWTARHNNILPLPARRQTAEGSQVFEYRPTVHSTAPAARADATAAFDRKSTERGPAVPPRVQQWKNALLDLSLRNRLINFSDRAAVSITVPEGHLGKIEDIVHGARGLHLLPANGFDDVHAARGVRTAADLPAAHLVDALLAKSAVYTGQLLAGYQTRMRGLAYKARTIVEETGANNLYLALGSLLWEVDGKPLRSPLVLVPVRLVSKSKQLVYRLELDESGTSTPNFCLLEKLRQLHGLTIPGLAEPAEDDAGIDLDGAMKAVRVAIAETGLRFRVEPTADLSILQFAKFRLWKDLDEHWSTLQQNPLVRHLVESPTDPFDDPVPHVSAQVNLDELDALCPVPADASQLKAVAEGVTGHTFVLEGPPGTGKSQTITNLLTRALAEGKRVLFVAEKRAALDVVRKRLDAVGVGPFSLDLHDKSSKPTVVRAQIQSALEHAVDVDDQGLSAQLESLQSSRRSLARYAARLHEPNVAGQSFYSARTALLALDSEGPAMPVPRDLVTGAGAERIAELRHVLAELPDTAEPARPSPDHPWRFVTATDPSVLRVDVARDLATQVDASIQGLPLAGLLHDLLAAVSRPEDLELLASLFSGPDVPLALLDETRSDSWRQATASLRAEITAFVAASHPGLDLATPAAMEMPLADIHTQAQAAAASSWFGRKKRLRAVLELLRPGLRPGLDVKPKQVPELVAALLQVQTTVRGIADRGRAVPGVKIPTSWNPLTAEGRDLVERQVGWLRWAGSAIGSSDTASDSAASRPSFGPALRQFLGTGTSIDQPSREATRRAAQAVRALSAWADTPPELWTAWSGQAGLIERWTATQNRRDLADPSLLTLRRWVALRAQLEPLRLAGLSDAYEALLLGDLAAEEAVQAFSRGVANASLEERRLTTGLDAFDPIAHDRAITRFAGSSQAIRLQMQTAIPSSVLANRPFQVDTGRGQVGALQRELAKQRRGLGVRALLGTYGELITQLMPCVLVSPDSVARFFPVGGALFDIVVFDEASQIRVADAVGAMGRSRSVVVVGDSKQMPPTSVAEPSSGNDDELAEEQLVVEDEESILSECVQARIKRHWLSWHYRSKDEALIAFSNYYYYEGRLSSFPAPTSGVTEDPDSPGIRLVRVDGTFHRSGKGTLFRTNPVEAEAVVAEIRRCFAQSPGRTPSIGVVTFNQQQRAYIEGLLRDAGDDRLVEAHDGTAEEGLFVKNLENVQGDERDVILFSTAFSVNEKGVLPLNFGPLNRGGGERRLNVAVTRARRQILVFSSFDPAQLRAEETSSVGVKHLRAYLNLAAEGATVLQRSRSTAPRDRHVEQVANGMRERGWRVETEVGMSDFKIDMVIEGKEVGAGPVVAVLMDGPSWRGRLTVGDRDGLPLRVLSDLLEWPAVERVWMPEWINDSARVLDRLETAARVASHSATARAGDRPSVPALHDASSVSSPDRSETAADVMREAVGSAGHDTPVPAEGRLRGSGIAPTRSSPADSFPTAAPTVSPRSASRLPGETDFVPWKPTEWRSREALDQLPSAWATGQVRRVINQVVEAEGPMTTDRLARLVASAFDLTKVSEGRKLAILRELPSDLRPQADEPFVWPRSLDPSSWTGFRRPRGEDPRPVDQISLRELGNAMVAICASSAGAHRDELLRETLGLFGGKRLTYAIQDRLFAALERAVASGRLRLEPGELYTALPPNG